jgi:hypothetical protein
VGGSLEEDEAEEDEDEELESSLLDFVPPSAAAPV